jgi:hypothetical protein
MLLANFAHLAVQVEEPGLRRKCRAPAPSDRAGRKVRGRIQLANADRLFFVQLYQWFPSILKAITIIRPKTIVRWHRAGFRRYWQWNLVRSQVGHQSMQTCGL